SGRAGNRTGAEPAGAGRVETRAGGNAKTTPRAEGKLRCRAVQIRGGNRGLAVRPDRHRAAGQAGDRSVDRGDPAPGNGRTPGQRAGPAAAGIGKPARTAAPGSGSLAQTTAGTTGELPRRTNHPGGANPGFAGAAGDRGATAQEADRNVGRRSQTAGRRRTAVERDGRAAKGIGNPTGTAAPGPGSLAETITDTARESQW